MTDALSLPMIPDATDTAAPLVPLPDRSVSPPLSELPFKPPPRAFAPPVSGLEGLLPLSVEIPRGSHGAAAPIPVVVAADEPAAEDYVRWLEALWASRLVGEGDVRPTFTLGVLLWPGFSLFTLALLQEVLRLAGEAAPTAPPRLALLGPASEAAVPAAGIGLRLAADTPYVRPDDLDLLLVLAGPDTPERLATRRDRGGLPAREAVDTRGSDGAEAGREATGRHLSEAGPADSGEPIRHRDYLRVAAAAGLTVGGCGGGVRVLVEEGLLANRRFGLDQRLQADLHAAFPGLAIVPAEAVLDQGRMTSADGVAVLSVLLPLIRARLGHEAVARIEAGLRLPAPVSDFSSPGPQMAAAVVTDAEGPVPARGQAESLPEARAIADPRIARAVVLIEARAGQNVSPSEMARAAGLSARQFSRLFRATLGMTPKHFILHTRLARARILVEQGTLSMAAIADQTGFADCAHFTTAFKARYGTAPRNLRPRRAPR
ncbi:hypothetical protein BTR14_06810 [Rhizobium rhizosphaerae]|uniref:HTH araC/xylS-type domain-containing protein n=1 Tax=Xaviernesmea rhizosphaerae TaxID=1672749 RepID=A0ABX3PF38_9HYPH|nr:helix-turn-helix domain-containing protein [Xaviernesmea rhizosphaerae]OQP87131.1 hypothetical protein BTR14_06810 [Xaviernesmea rhizosphaerae]